MAPRAHPGADEREQGRESFGQGAWKDAYESLSRADQAAPLGAEDLELLATSAFMLGRLDDFLSVIERAHHAYLGVNLSIRGEMGRATGWFGRAQRLVEREGRECVEQGYLLLPVAMQPLATGSYETASVAAAEAAETGERFRDADLLALAVHTQGQILIKQGRIEEGLALMDEAMVAVIAGEVSPIIT